MQNNSEYAIKMQLTRSAVERLIGDNPELQVQLTNQVAGEIVKKYVLKSVNCESKIAELSKKINTEVLNLIAREVGTFTSSWSDQFKDFQLNSDLRFKIVAQVSFMVQQQIGEMVKEQVANQMQHIKSLVDQEVGKYTNAIVLQSVKARLEESFKTIKEDLK